jgi:hypothetical protein
MFDLNEAVLFEACGETEGDPDSPERHGAIMAKLPPYHPWVKDIFRLVAKTLMDHMRAAYVAALNKQPSPESDRDEWIFAVSRSYMNAIRKDETAIEAVPLSRIEWTEAAAALHKGDEIDQAAAFFICCRQSLGAGARHD